MNIGVPREHRADEHRVGLTPAGVELLSAAGHHCVVEAAAGLGAGFHDEDYERAGGRIVYSDEEVYGRAELILKVERPTLRETELLKDGATVMGFLHLAVCPREQLERMLAKRITAVAYELIQEENGALPVLVPLSQAAGRMTPQIAAGLLQNNSGGKGILLGGVPGVPPAEVVILGAGTFGHAAAMGFLGAGASVYVLDRDLARLQAIDQQLSHGARIVTMVSHAFNIRKVAKFADVLVGAVLEPGVRAPVVVPASVLALMKPRSVVMDISIDQGGCVENIRPTTHRDPVYLEGNILHYAVPNMTSVVARTATHAFNNAAWPYIREVARVGVASAVADLPALRRGALLYNGRVTSAPLQAALGLPGGER
jgi:alanine dehydrogenase